MIDGNTSTVITTLAVGEFPILMTADPVSGLAYVTNQNEDTVSVIAELGPTDLITMLITHVASLGLPGSLENSLMSKLNGALDKLQDNNPNNDSAAIGKLNAFINQVAAQRGKNIPQPDADALIAAAEEIIGLI